MALVLQESPALHIVPLQQYSPSPPQTNGMKRQVPPCEQVSGRDALVVLQLLGAAIGQHA
jgi:hypothetical protein